MKCWVMKHIWYLPTWGQECTVLKLQPILFGKFDLEHPVGIGKEIFFFSVQSLMTNEKYATSVVNENFTQYSK